MSVLKKSNMLITASQLAKKKKISRQKAQEIFNEYFEKRHPAITLIFSGRPKRVLDTALLPLRNIIIKGVGKRGKGKKNKY